MIPSHDLGVRSGNGWTIVETAGIQQTPGARDIGKPLGIGEGAVLLVILRAAERWAPDDETMPDGCAILRHEGRMLVDFIDGSTQPLDAERDSSTAEGGSLGGVVNIGTGLAKALVIARWPAGPGARGR
jgi:hypothetical protein